MSKILRNPVVQAIGIAVGATAAIWVVAYHEVIFTSVFAPKFAEVRRKTFQESESMVRGTNKELAQLRVAYLKEKDPDAKEALRDLILETAQNTRESNISPDLRYFIQSLKDFQ